MKKQTRRFADLFIKALIIAGSGLGAYIFLILLSGLIIGIYDGMAIKFGFSPFFTDPHSGP